MNDFPKAPNLDVVIGYGPGAGIKEAGIECKFSEAYSSSPKGLREPYLVHSELWSGLPNCHELARTLCPNDRQFSRLHAAQLLKHMLGLKFRNGKSGFYLLYLWYDVPGKDGAVHRSEVAAFQKIARSDGIKFRGMSYQELIVDLAARNRKEHRAYVDYIVERYL